MARYHRSDLGGNARVSTEITGYAVSTLLYLYRRTGREQYLDRAMRAGRFLCRGAWDRAAGAMPFEHPSNGDGSSLTYFFDCGIIVRGLLALWRTAGDDEYLEMAKCCGHSMRRDFAGDGCFHPILALPSKRPLDHEPRWSREPGCYQLKAALAFRSLAEATGDSAWLAVFDAELGRALKNQAGFLPGASEWEHVMDRLHAFCYFLEALLAVPAQREVLANGIGLAARLARQIAPAFARSDVWAQILRVRLYASAAGLVPLDEAAAAEEASAAAAFQQAGGDPRVDGGFWFGRKAGRILSFSNPVSTGFCLQALDLWERRSAIRPSLDDLI